jgi:hypothetical protein
MTFLILKDGVPPNKIVTKCLRWNIIMTLCGIDIFKMKDWSNDDDDDNDTNVPDEAIEAPNDSDYHEPHPKI